MLDNTQQQQRHLLEMESPVGNTDIFWDPPGPYCTSGVEMQENV